MTWFAFNGPLSEDIIVVVRLFFFSTERCVLPSSLRSTECLPGTEFAGIRRKIRETLSCRGASIMGVFGRSLESDGDVSVTASTDISGVRPHGLATVCWGIDPFGTGHHGACHLRWA